MGVFEKAIPRIAQDPYTGQVGIVPIEEPVVDDLFDPIFNREVRRSLRAKYGNSLWAPIMGYSDMLDNAWSGDSVLGKGMGVLSTFGRTMEKADDAILGGLTEGVNLVTGQEAANPFDRIFVDDFDYEGRDLLAAAANSMSQLAGGTTVTRDDFDGIWGLPSLAIDLTTDVGIAGQLAAAQFAPKVHAASKAGTMSSRQILENLGKQGASSAIGEVGQLLSDYDDFMTRVAIDATAPGLRPAFGALREKLGRYLSTHSPNDFAEFKITYADLSNVINHGSDPKLRAELIEKLRQDPVASTISHLDEQARRAFINPEADPDFGDISKLVATDPDIVDLENYVKYQIYQKLQQQAYGMQLVEEGHSLGYSGEDVLKRWRELKERRRLSRSTGSGTIPYAESVKGGTADGGNIFDSVEDEDALRAIEVIGEDLDVPDNADFDALQEFLTAIGIDTNLEARLTQNERMLRSASDGIRNSFQSSLIAKESDEYFADESKAVTEVLRRLEDWRKRDPASRTPIKVKPSEELTLSGALAVIENLLDSGTLNKTYADEVRQYLFPNGKLDENRLLDALESDSFTNNAATNNAILRALYGEGSKFYRSRGPVAVSRSLRGSVSRMGQTGSKMTYSAFYMLNSYPNGAYRPIYSDPKSLWKFSRRKEFKLAMQRLGIPLSKRGELVTCIQRLTFPGKLNEYDYTQELHKLATLVLGNTDESSLKHIGTDAYFRRLKDTVEALVDAYLKPLHFELPYTSKPVPDMYAKVRDLRSFDELSLDSAASYDMSREFARVLDDKLRGVDITLDDLRQILEPLFPYYQFTPRGAFLDTLYAGGENIDELLNAWKKQIFPEVYSQTHAKNAYGYPNPTNIYAKLTGKEPQYDALRNRLGFGESKEGLAEDYAHMYAISKSAVPSLRTWEYTAKAAKDALPEPPKGRSELLEWYMDLPKNLHNIEDGNVPKPPIPKLNPRVPQEYAIISSHKNAFTSPYEDLEKLITLDEAGVIRDVSEAPIGPVLKQSLVDAARERIESALLYIRSGIASDLSISTENLNALLKKFKRSGFSKLSKSEAMRLHAYWTQLSDVLRDTPYRAGFVDGRFRLITYGEDFDLRPNLTQIAEIYNLPVDADPFFGTLATLTYQSAKSGYSKFLPYIDYDKLISKSGRRRIWDDWAKSRLQMPYMKQDTVVSLLGKRLKKAKIPSASKSDDSIEKLMEAYKKLMVNEAKHQFVYSMDQPPTPASTIFEQITSKINPELAKKFLNSGGEDAFEQASHKRVWSLFERIHEAAAVRQRALQGDKATLRSSKAKAILGAAWLGALGISHEESRRFMNLQDAGIGDTVRGVDFFDTFRKAGYFQAAYEKGAKELPLVREALQKNATLINQTVGSDVVEVVERKLSNGNVSIALRWNIDDRKLLKKLRPALADLEKAQFVDVVFAEPIRLTPEEMAFVRDPKFNKLRQVILDTQALAKEQARELGFAFDDGPHIKHVMNVTEGDPEWVAKEIYGDYSYEKVGEFSALLSNSERYRAKDRGLFGAISSERRFRGRVANFDDTSHHLFTTDPEQWVRGYLGDGMFANAQYQMYYDIVNNGNFKIGEYFKTPEELRRVFTAVHPDGKVSGNMRNLELVAPRYSDEGRFLGFTVFDKTSDKGLEQALRNPETMLLPANAISHMQSLIRKEARMSNKFWTFINKYFTIPFKFAVLNNPGFLIGNLGDAFLKQAATMSTKYGTSFVEEVAETAASMRTVISLQNTYQDVFEKYLNALKAHDATIPPEHLIPDIVAGSSKSRRSFLAWLNEDLVDKNANIIPCDVTKDEVDAIKYWFVLQDIQKSSNVVREFGDVDELFKESNFETDSNLIERLIYGTGKYDKRAWSTYGIFLGNPVTNGVLKSSEAIESLMRSAMIVNDLRHKRYSPEEIAEVLKSWLDAADSAEVKFSVDVTDAMDTMFAANFDYERMSDFMDNASKVIPFPTFFLKNFGYWMEVWMDNPQLIDNLMDVQEGLWATTPTEDDEFARDAKGRGAIPVGGPGLPEWFKGYFKPSPLQSMFGAFNLLNDPIGNVSYRLHPALNAGLVAGARASGLTTSLGDPSEIRYRPYSTNVYERNITAEDPKFNPLEYALHRANPYERATNTYLRTGKKVERGDAQLSDFLPSVFQPKF